MLYPRVTHLTSMRLSNNAGLRIPYCKANARLLDLDSSGLRQTRDRDAVTCKKCNQLMKNNRWA